MNSQRKDKPLWLKSITVMLIAVLCFLAILCGNAKSAMADTVNSVELKNQLVEFSSWQGTVFYNSEGEKTYVEPVYRLYNNVSSEHLFTTDKTEYDNLLKLTKEGKSNWIGEDINWYSVDYGKVLYNTEGKIDGFYYPDESSKCEAVYRLYNPALGAMARCSHYYTSDEKEIIKLCNNYGWKREKIAFWSYGDTPIYTAYSEALGSQHHYTSSKSEWQGLDAGWDKEKSKNGTVGFFGAITAPTETSKSTTSHTHSWKATYGQVYIVDQEAYEEPRYEMFSVCTGCGEVTPSSEHSSQHLIKGEPAGTHGELLLAYYVHHDEVGHYEQGIVGYKCTCGKTK